MQRVGEWRVSSPVTYIYSAEPEQTCMTAFFTWPWGEDRSSHIIDISDHYSSGTGTKKEGGEAVLKCVGSLSHQIKEHQLLIKLRHLLLAHCLVLAFLVTFWITIVMPRLDRHWRIWLSKLISLKDTWSESRVAILWCTAITSHVIRVTFDHSSIYTSPVSTYHPFMRNCILHRYWQDRVITGTIRK